MIGKWQWKIITSLTPDRAIFSDPAKSTRFNLPHFMSSSSPTVVSLTWMFIEKTACDRLQEQNAESLDPNRQRPLYQKVETE